MTEFLRLIVPVALKIPPPLSVPVLSLLARLFATVTKFRFAVTDPVAAGCSTTIPPPFPFALFPLTVLFVTEITEFAPLVAPELFIRIPPAGPVAVLPEIVLLRIVRFMAPPVALRRTPAPLDALLPL